MQRPTIDKGYSWVVAFAASVVVFFQIGLANAIGVFVTEFEEHLQIDALTAGLCTSVAMGLRGVFGPVWTVLTKNVSCRTLVMTGGLMSCLGMICVSLSKSVIHLGLSMALISIGSGLPSVTKVVHLKKYFVEKYNTAVSLVFTGGTISMLVLSPTVEYLVIYFGWRGAMLIYGALNLNISVAGALMTEPRAIVDKGSKQNLVKGVAHRAKHGSSSLVHDEANKCWKLCKIIVNSFGFSVISEHPVLVVYLLAMTLHELVLTGWVLFLISYSISHGYDIKSASFLAAIGGGGALAMRMISGPVIDNTRISGLMMFFILAVGGAVSLACYPLCKTYLSLSLISFVAGMCLGSTTPVYIVMLKEIFLGNTSGFAAAIGLQYMFRGVGMLAGGPFTGLLYDETGSFEFSFTILAILEGVAAVMILAKLIYFSIAMKLVKPVAIIS